MLLDASRLSVAMLELVQVSWVLDDHAWVCEGLVVQRRAVERQNRQQTAVAAIETRLSRHTTQTVSFSSDVGKLCARMRRLNSPRLCYVETALSSRQ